MAQKTRREDENGMPQGIIVESPLGSNQKEILLFVLELADGKPRRQVPWSYPPRPSRGESDTMRVQQRIAITRSLCKLERRGLVVRHRKSAGRSSPTVGVELTQEGWQVATRLREDARRRGSS